MRSRRGLGRRRLHGRVWICALIALQVRALIDGSVATAVTPQSPEVVAMIERGMKYLETHSDDRLGGKCLIGLAFHKRGKPDSHPAIQAALESCKKSLSSEKQDERVYSKALAVIFLCEVDPQNHRDLIADYARLVVEHQMPHGGFGYKLPSEFQGDTSQTQYAALAYWEMLQSGVAPDVTSVEACANWLLRTQSNDGGWAYKGRDPESFERIGQVPTSTCMLSAGLSSVLICGNILGLLRPASLNAEAQSMGATITLEKLPDAVRRADLGDFQSGSLKPTGAVELDRLLSSARDGRAWFNKNFEVSNGSYYPHYALYALERYKSFEEYLQGDVAEEPQWYDSGYEYLKKYQQPDGRWEAYGEATAPCSTAFSVLFLMRSTQASIRERLGEGTLVGGRGLPRDLSKVKLRGGRIVVEQRPTQIDELLEMLENSTEDGNADDPITDILGTPGAIAAGDVGPAQVRQLERLVRTGKADERVVAVEALSTLRRLDSAPTLIFALSDPDRRVVRVARDGLQSVSREFEGFGPPDNFDDSQRDAAIAEWKAWYQRIRPDAAAP